MTGVGVGGAGTAPRSPGRCGGIGWSWSGSSTLRPLCMCCLQQAYFPQKLPKNIYFSLLYLIFKKSFGAFFPFEAKIQILPHYLAFASFDQQPLWLVLILQIHNSIFAFGLLSFPRFLTCSDSGPFKSYLYGNHASRKPSLITSAPLP